MMPTFISPLNIDVGTPEPEPSWRNQSLDLDKMIEDGYTIRAIVTRKSNPVWDRCNPEQWGVIVRINRYGGNDSKPFVCKFFGHVVDIPCSREELSLVHPALSYTEIHDRMEEQDNGK
ncbi:MAG: hypothetical protein NUV80_06525 [Candidatus Berkelbacteria bacterium]|nr:hypothetical protein [Candidatus Berkelbacteria bacterium]